MPKDKETKTTEVRNENKNNIAWAWVLTAGMVGSAFLMCLCGRGCTKGTGCRECNQPKKDTVYVVKEKPSIDVDGDAIIINGDNNDATLIKGNGNNSANRCSGNGNQNRGTVKPKPEPKPEPECKTVTTTTYEHFCISGDANDVVTAAIKIVNSNHR